MDQKPSEQVSRPFPTDPIHLPPPPDSSQIDPGAAPQENQRKGVVIVAGGAGVASFGLIGILKRFQMERIKIDALVVTGWPAVVALGYGFLKSIHDVEWMASRISEADMETAGKFSDEKRLLDTAQFPRIFESNFGSREINQSKIPLVIAAVNTDLGRPDTYDRGDWRYPLGKTLSIPGIYRSTEDFDLADIQAIDIAEAQRRGSVIVVLNFYDDFFTAIDESQHKLASTAFMKTYAKQLRKDLSEKSKEAALVGKVTVKGDFDNLSFRRQAIVNGYQEGTRLAKEVRALLK